MTSMIILGAGMFGQASLDLLNRSHFELLAFGDNALKLHGTSICGIPVLSIKEAAARNPDCMLIAVTDEERSRQLKAQAVREGYRGSFLMLKDLRDQIDIRSGTIRRLAARIRSAKVEGDLAELGVYQGETSALLNELFPERTLYLFDTFQGFAEKDIKKEEALKASRSLAGEFADTSVSAVRDRLPHPSMAVFRQGYFPDTARGLEEKRFAFVSLDADLYEPTLAGLEYFYPRMTCGGVIVLHDYGSKRFSGVQLAVQDYEAAHGRLPLVPLCDLHGSAVLVSR